MHRFQGKGVIVTGASSGGSIGEDQLSLKHATSVRVNGGTT